MTSTPSRRRLASERGAIRSAARPWPPGSETAKRTLVASTTSSRRRASHGASVSSEPPSLYVSAVSRNVPPASTKRSSIRWDSSTGVLLPISMVPRQRRETVRGPSGAVSIRGTLRRRVRAMSGPRFGLTGLAVMGANLARNVAHHDIPIAVHNRTASKTEQFMAEHGSEGPITGTGSTKEFVQTLERPRTIMTMVKAGPAVDAVIEELAPLLDEDDTIVDGGNSHFRDTQRRDKAMAERGLRFLGVGVSGGEEGALNGPSIMPGGAQEAYADVEEGFTSIAAQVDGTACCTYVGADGAGHYVKMVHNGIEYADIQLIAEAYDLLRHGVGLEVPEIAQVFHEWNEGDLDSFLIEITAQVLDKADPRSAEPLVDVILDQAEPQWTGRAPRQDALQLGVPLTGITEAVFARSLSAHDPPRKTGSHQ